MLRIKLYAFLILLSIIVYYQAAAYFCDAKRNPTADDRLPDNVPAVPSATGDKDPPNQPAQPPQRDSRMQGLAEFAGYFASHAIWCVSDDEMLVPMLAWEDAAGKRDLERFEGENRSATQAALAKLEQNPNRAVRGVLVVDGFVTVNNVKRDTLIIQARQFGEPKLSLHFTIPYRTKAAGGFGVHRPVFDNSGSFEGWKTAGRDSGPEIDAFLLGIKSHEKGFAVWQSKQLD